MRGEYREYWITDRDHGELPPRARRIHLRKIELSIPQGTTSACAENTGYLCSESRVGCELPPRARRIRCPRLAGVGGMGTTSACAENTPLDNQPTNMLGNYLRVRGEYHSQVVTASVPWELPPRARRILPIDGLQNTFYGTTSACAENTRTVQQFSTL